MASQGPLSPSAASQTDAGATWNNINNALASDDTYATVTPGTNSKVLHLTNFGFTIPASSTIDGIIVECEWKVDTVGSAYSDEIALEKHGGGVSGDRATGGFIDTTEGYDTFGGAADLWDTTFNEAQINGVDFGVRITLADGTGIGTVSLDHVRITVHYTTTSGQPARKRRRRSPIGVTGVGIK